MPVRKTLLAASCCAVLVPLPALAGAASAELVMQDPAGDANGVNDQGSEHLIGNVATSGASSPEADLLRVRLSSLREGGRTTGWSVAFRTAGPVGPHQGTGQDLAYGLVAQPTEDCRFTVTYTTHGADGGTAAFASGGGCGGAAGAIALPATQTGSVVRVDLPYRLLPPAVAPGVRLPDVSAYVRLVPGGTAAVGELDNVLRGPHSYRLPAA